MSKKEFPNVTEVRLAARETWEARQLQRKSRIEKISGSIDFWIVLIVLSFVALSIPHTMKVFDMITPGWGKLAFIGLELGLLYRSFRGKVARITHEGLPLSLRLMGWILFVSLVVANGVGAFIAVADAQSAIADQSLRDLVSLWPTMPAESQIALVLVPLAALMIPIGTIVGGEGLAALFLEVRQDGNPMDEQWLQVRQDVEFMALRDAALNLGHTPNAANKWASEVVGMDQSVRVSASSDNIGRGQPDGHADTHRTVSHNTGQGYSKNMSARDQAVEYLERYGDTGASVRQFAEMVGIGKTTAADVLKEYRTNGHSGNHEE